MTHVNTAVGAVDVADVQRPRVQVAVKDRETGIVGQNSIVHGQNAFVVGLDPGHLLVVVDLIVVVVDVDRRRAKKRENKIKI